MKNRKNNMIYIGFLFIISASIIIMVGSRLLNINLPRFAYGIITVINLLIYLFNKYYLVNIIMLDPTMRLYLKDINGEYVSLDHFRKGLIEGENFFENQDASYNGEEFDKKSYFQYMSKNLFRFSSGLIYADVKDERELGQIELIPKGYSIKYFPNKNKFVYHPTIFWNI